VANAARPVGGSSREGISGRPDLLLTLTKETVWAGNQVDRPHHSNSDACSH
jgi:hypothetical protein